MTTIIRATGVKFNNPNLPIISPLVMNGLIAGFRPSSNTSSLRDLSGNGHTLTQKGNPEFTQYGVKGDIYNGLITDVVETKNLTILAISRVYKNNNTHKGFIVSTFADLDGSNNDTGSSLFYMDSGNNPNLLVNTHGRNTGNGNQDNIIQGLGEDKTGLDPSSFVFTALVVDTSKNKLFGYTPNKQATAIVDYGVDYLDLSQRLLYNNDLKQPNYFYIATAPKNIDDWQAKVEIAEVLFYDRALTQAEIMQQYHYSKDFMLKNRGITI